MAVKDNHRIKLVEYIGNLDNDFPTRSYMALTVLGYKNIESLYKLYSLDELAEIEAEGLEMRKKNSQRQRAILYDSLFLEAKSGNVAAIKEYLDRTEGRVVDRKEITGKDGKELAPILNVNLDK